MFLRTLRQLSIEDKGEYFIVHYRCNKCNGYVKVYLDAEELTDLKNGFPFDAAIKKEKLQNLQHFKKGQCKNEYCT